MLIAGIMTKRISGSEKGSYYSRIFPINTKPMSIDTINQIRFFALKVKDAKQTNILEFVEYCFTQIHETLWIDRDSDM